SERTTSGGENEGGGGDQPGEGDLSGSTGERDEESPTKNKVLITVGFRSFAHKENGNLYHILMVHSDRHIDEAELEILVGSDNDREDGIGIEYCDAGTAVNNKIKDIELREGNNKIKVQFADDLAH